MNLSLEDQIKILKNALSDFRVKEKRKSIYFKNKKQNKSFPYEIFLRLYKDDNDALTPDLCWIHIELLFEKYPVTSMCFHFANSCLKSQSFLKKLKSIFNFKINFSEYDEGKDDGYYENLLIEMIEFKFQNCKDFRIN